VSVVVPVLDEQEVLVALHARLASVADDPALDARVEMIFVDDGSTDASLSILHDLAGRDGRVRVLALTRNFGQEAACAAGLDHAAGDAVVVMDADLQDPPELLVELVERWRRGCDVVHARRSSRRGDGLLKRAAACGFYRFMSVGSDARIVPDAGGFRLLDRSIVDALAGARDRGRFLRGLACWVGGRQAQVRFERRPREGGRTKYGWRRQGALALDAVTGFSALPVRLMGCTGALLAAAGLAGAAAVVALACSGRLAGPGGWAATASVALCSGLVLVGLWVVGEYVMRVGREVRGLPLYVVDERVGFADGPGAARDEPAGEATAPREGA
jgi:dolichol-phosphate mannosyltransferase